LAPALLAPAGRAETAAATNSKLQKVFVGQAGFLDDRVHGALGQVAGVVGNSGPAFVDGMAPNFMAAFRLTVEDESRPSQLAYDLGGFQGTEVLLGGGDGNFPVGFHRQGWSRGQAWRKGLALGQVGFHDFAGDILGDFERFGDRAPLRDQTLQSIAGRQITAFFQSFHGDRDQIFGARVHEVSVT